MKFNLSDLSVDEVNTILGGLMELPAKFSVNVMAKIRQQVDEQQASTQTTTVVDADGPLVN